MINNTYLFFLLIVEIMLLMISIKRIGKDIFSPSIYSLGVFLVCTCLTIYCIRPWKIHFAFATFEVIALGLITMVVSEMLFYRSHHYDGKNSGFKILNIGKKTKWIIAIICIVCTFLYYREIRRLGTMMAINSLGAIGAVKENYGDFGITMNPFIRQGYKVVIALSFISNFYFCNNILNKRPLKELIPLIIPFFCAVVISLLGGARSEMLRQLLTFAFMYYVQYRMQSNWKAKPNKKIIKFLVPSMAVLLVFFFSVRLVIKENGDAQKSIGGPIEYLSYYIASPIEVLDIHVQEIEKHNPEYASILASQPFDGIRELLEPFGIRLKARNHTYGWGFAYLGDNDYAGNVDTIFGPPHMDYGLLGMIIYVFLIYSIFNYVYYRKILYGKFNYNFASTLIYYSFFFYEVILCFYSDCTYLILSQTGFLQFFVLWLFCRLLVRSSFKSNP